jgi:sulfur-oxidizing protein SoxZ
MSQVRMRVDKAKPGEVVTVRAMVTHPMEVMQFKGGKPVEKNYNFINRVEATFNGKKVFEAETTQAVSQNPFVMFPVKADKPGKLEVTFHDTQGKTYVGHAEINF